MKPFVEDVENPLASGRSIELWLRSTGATGLASEYTAKNVGITAVVVFPFSRL